MSSSRLSIAKLFIYTFYASLISAFFNALVETVHVAMNTRVGYLGSWDIVVINLSLFLIYTIIWFICLVVIAFLLKQFSGKLNFQLGLPCIFLFLYNLFWIASNVVDNKLYMSLFGLFKTFTLIVSAALAVAAVFMILNALEEKGYLRNIGLKLFAFGLVSLAYLMTYVYLKTSSGENFSPIYSIALLFSFFVIFLLLLFLLRKIMGRYQKDDFSKIKKGVKYVILFIPFVASISYYVYAESSKSAGDPSNPNILFISIDTLRADHVSVYDEIDKQTTPNIDHLAKKGYAFKKAYSPSSWTLPSHATMMTGLFPATHHADRSDDQTQSRFVDPLPASSLTLAEVLKDNGYLTAGIISNPFVSSTFGLDQGFDYFDDQVDLFQNIKYLSLKDCSLLFRILRRLKIIDRNDYDGEQRVLHVNKNAVNWIENHKDDSQPFFLFLHYNEPHYIYEPPSPYNKKSNGEPIEYFTEISRLMEGFYSLSSSGLNDVLTLYDGEISYLDHHLGLLFKRLEQLQLLQDTVIIITSDHGESFNEHEIWQHGNRLYEEQIRVPMIFYYPKLIPKGHMDNKNIVQLTDLFPTVLNILKIKIPDHIQGRSLLPLFKGSSESKFNFSFSEIKPDIRWKVKNKRSGYGMKSIRHHDWKYILSDNGKEELYKLDVDPYEMRNLANKERDKANEMNSLMDVFYKTIAQKRSTTTDKIDSGRLEQLRQLGYVQ